MRGYLLVGTALLSGRIHLDIDRDVIIIALAVALIAIIFAVLAAISTVNSVLTKDDDEPLESREGTIIEKSLPSARAASEASKMIEWLIFECDDGERLRLRNIHPENIVLAVGDIGEIQYRGETIYGFNREKV